MKLLLRNYNMIHTLSMDRQRGATLIEFSFIMLPLAMLFYGVIVYSIVFVTQQAVTYAAESGADAIVAVDPTYAAFDGQAESVARTRVINVLSFLPGAPSVCLGVLNGDEGCSRKCDKLGDGSTPEVFTYRQCTVQVTYEFSQWGSLVEGFLPVPDTITGIGLVNTQLPPAT